MTRIGRIDTDRSAWQPTLLAPGSGMLKNERLTRRVIGVFYDVYNELGYGFLESVYAEALAIALGEARLELRREAALCVAFRGRPVGQFRADMIVEDALIVELKAGKLIDDSHRAQLLNYLRASGIELGLLLNFGPRPEFRRVILDRRR